MVDTTSLRITVDDAWSIFRATHAGVADSRRCLVEQREWQAREGNAEVLPSFGLGNLARLPDKEC